MLEPATPANGGITSGPEPASQRKRRTWPWRLAIVVLVALAVGVPAFWWLLRTPPLRAEEQAFVGYWTSPPPEKPIDRRLNPVVTLAAEYRPDRTFHWHRHDTRTGVRFIEEMGRWRAEDGHLIEVFQQPYQVQGLVQGNLPRSETFNWRVTWENSDRFRLDRVQLPPGVIWPTFVSVRCQAPTPASEPEDPR